ncbi:Threonylcarbamoyl-AMP synthase, partial [Dissostichus eleginoides]
ALDNQSVGRVVPQAVKPRHSARAMLNTRHLDPPPNPYIIPGRTGMTSDPGMCEQQKWTPPPPSAGRSGGDRGRSLQSTGLFYRQPSCYSDSKDSQ